MHIPGLGDGVEIGVGASASVYRATQLGLEREVAVKVLKTTDPAFIRRFQREARVLGRLSQSSGIVSVYDTGVDELGQPYLMLELCQSSLLDRLKADGALPAPEACRIMGQVSTAVAEAHAMSVVHRDIKPGNVLVTADGRHLVADFGISVAEDLTAGQTNSVGFTAGYVAPEVIHGAEPGPAADVYALGATLYHLLAGRAPFAAAPGEDSDNLMELADRVANEEPPDLADLGVPAVVVDAVAAAMAKDPLVRPEAGEFGFHLSTIAQQLEPDATTVSGIADGFTDGAGVAALDVVDADGVVTQAAPALPLTAQPSLEPAVIGGAGLLSAAPPAPMPLEGMPGQPSSRIGDVFDRWPVDRLLGVGLLAVGLVAVVTWAMLNLPGQDGSSTEAADLNPSPPTSDLTDTTGLDVGLDQNDDDGGDSAQSGLGDIIPLPSTVGLTEKEAVETLQDAGFRVLVVRQESDAEPGTVIRQDPDTDEAVERKLINIYVATERPTPTVAVPDLAGQTVADANAALAALDLDPAGTTEVFDSAAAGTVVGTEPAAGSTVNLGTDVTLVVSRGLPAVPDLVGLSVADAAAALAGQTLTVGLTTTEPNFLVAEGQVTSSSPAAGTEVDSGAAVDLVASSGPPCEVPNVVGQPEGTARLTLLGCPVDPTSIGEVSPGAEPGTVVRVETGATSLQLVVALSDDCELDGDSFEGQPIGNLELAILANPQCDLVVVEREDNDEVPGTILRVRQSGNTITATVATTETCTMPNVVNADGALARLTIRTAGCSGPISGANLGQTVVSSNPPAGTEIPVGSAIELLTEVVPPSCVIPGGLVGQTEAAARAALTAANCGVTVGTIPVPAGDPRAGIVMVVDPGSGTFPNGAAVNIGVGAEVEAGLAP